MRKGHAVTPVWLQQLRKLRNREGQPPFEHIATSVNLSEAVVHSIFTGRTEPHRAELVLIVEALSYQQAEIDKVLSAYDHRNEPPPPLPEPPPTWLALLRVERYSRGNPTLRELAARSGLPRSTVGEIFRGTATQPFEETLLKLAVAICENDPEAADRIMTAFGRDNAPPFPFPELDFDTRSDTVRLADAMNNLAQAITGLAAAIRTVHLPRDPS